MTIDIDAKILYWIDYFEYKWIDCGKLIDYIKDNWVRTKEEVVRHYMEAMKYNNVDINDLDWNYICEKDNDYEKLYDNLYINIYELENSKEYLQKIKLIR